MAIARIGSIVEIPANHTGSLDANSTSVSVPADAELMVFGVSGYSGAASLFSGTTPTIGGDAMTPVQFDSSTSYMQGCLFYRFLPKTGTQTLAWNWGGTGDMTYGGRYSYGFYKGMDTSGVRDAQAAQQNDPHPTPTLTALSGDLIVAYSAEYTGTDATTTWTNATKVVDCTMEWSVDSAWAEGSPSGDVAVTCDFSVAGDGGIAAIVLKPSVSTTPITVNNLSVDSLAGGEIA